MTGLRAKTPLHLAAGCAFALLLALGTGAASAHHGGGHSGGHNGGDHMNGGHGDHMNGGHNHKGRQHASNHGGDWSSHRRRHHHHHHHHHKKSAGFGPVHGPGSSHNPIVTHPPKVPKPVVAVGPAKPPGEPIVRDHRNPPSSGGRRRPSRFNPHCRKRDISGCEVRDHRTQPKPQCYGDLC